MSNIERLRLRGSIDRKLYRPDPIIPTPSLMDELTSRSPRGAVTHTDVTHAAHHDRPLPMPAVHLVSPHAHADLFADELLTDEPQEALFSTSGALNIEALKISLEDDPRLLDEETLERVLFQKGQLNVKALEAILEDAPSYAIEKALGRALFQEGRPNKDVFAALLKYDFHSLVDDELDNALFQDDQPNRDIFEVVLNHDPRLLDESLIRNALLRDRQLNKDILYLLLKYEQVEPIIRDIISFLPYEGLLNINIDVLKDIIPKIDMESIFHILAHISDEKFAILVEALKDNTSWGDRVVEELSKGPAFITAQLKNIPEERLQIVKGLFQIS